MKQKKLLWAYYSCLVAASILLAVGVRWAAYLKPKEVSFTRDYSIESGSALLANIVVLKDRDYYATERVVVTTYAGTFPLVETREVVTREILSGPKRNK